MPLNNKYCHAAEQIERASAYNFQCILDQLFEQSLERKSFTDLLGYILSEENILLAYQNVWSQLGKTGSDFRKQEWGTIGGMSMDQVRNTLEFILKGSVHGYRPKPTRLKEIRRPDGSARKICIPEIWDRLVQQCILQIIEPICEARFSNNSYGYRSNRCAEHAIAETHRLMQRSHMRYIIECEVGELSACISHAKLIRQIWALGIRDRTLIFILKRILRSPVRMPDGRVVMNETGIIQGGILGPVFLNIALNELDQWIDSQWQEHPVIHAFKCPVNSQGVRIKSNAYSAMRKTNLKEMYIIRYGEHIRIFCRKHWDAVRTGYAVEKWLRRRMKLSPSAIHIKIVDTHCRYMKFLGFKLKLFKRGTKWVVKSHVDDDRIRGIYRTLKRQFAKIPHARNKHHATSLIRRYNISVLAIQHYYDIATDVSIDFRKVQYLINIVAKGRLHANRKNKGLLVRNGRMLSEFEKKRYGCSTALRYYKRSGEPVYPIGYANPRPPLSKKRSVCSYTPEGRRQLSVKNKVHLDLLIALMKRTVRQESLEYNANRIALYSAQKGKCGITNRVFRESAEIHCHHIIPRKFGGSDKAENLILVLDSVHRLIHMVSNTTAAEEMNNLRLTKPMLKKINKLREAAGNQPVML